MIAPLLYCSIAPLLNMPEKKFLQLKDIDRYKVDIHGYTVDILFMWMF